MRQARRPSIQSNHVRQRSTLLPPSLDPRLPFDHTTPLSTTFRPDLARWVRSLRRDRRLLPRREHSDRPELQRRLARRGRLPRARPALVNFEVGMEGEEESRCRSPVLERATQVRLLSLLFFR